MKTLSDHVILYDQECPLCQAYTGLFTQSGMLDSDGRMIFSAADNGQFPALDRDRARNEIALVNRQTQQVTYGIDSLFAIIGNSWPVFQGLFANQFFGAAMKQLYAFISYNRKVIAPGSAFETPDSCTPDFHVGYRWAYILFALSMGLILLPNEGLLPASVVLTTVFFVQGLLAFFLKPTRCLHYLGNLATLFLVGTTIWGTLSLLPLAANIQLALFLLLQFFLLIQHAKRARILGFHVAINLPILLLTFGWFLG